MIKSHESLQRGIGPITATALIAAIGDGRQFARGRMWPPGADWFYPYTYDLAKQLMSIANTHQDFSYGAFWAGMNVGQIRELEAADLINQLVLEIKTL